MVASSVYPPGVSSSATFDNRGQAKLGGYDSLVLSTDGLGKTNLLNYFCEIALGEFATDLGIARIEPPLQL